MGCPFSGNSGDASDGSGSAPAGGYGGKKATEPRVYTRSDLTYNSYLKIPELLAIQSPQSAPAHNDELLFIIIHQAYELWFKLILHEFESIGELLGKDQLLGARHHLHRCVEIMRLLVQQIHILETMAPSDFLKFRDLLNPASGFQSLQFRELEFAAGLKNPKYMSFFKNRPEMLEVLERRLKQPDLRELFLASLKRQGFEVPISDSSTEDEEKIILALLPVYRDPQTNLPLYLFCESLVDFDAQLSHWREHHVKVVERIIGFKMGTGGSSGVDYLESTTGKRCFRFLWKLRTYLD